MAKNNKKPEVKTQRVQRTGKSTKQNKKDAHKKKVPINAEELDRQLFSYMGESGKKLVLDDELTTYFKTGDL